MLVEEDLRAIPQGRKFGSGCYVLNQIMQSMEERQNIRNTINLMNTLLQMRFANWSGISE